MFKKLSPNCRHKRWRAPDALLLVFTLMSSCICLAFSEFAIAHNRSEPYLFTMYRYPIAERGFCMSEPEESPAVVLQRNGISTQGRLTSSELSALAKGVGQIEKLLGRPLPPSWRARYNFISSSGGSTWNQGRFAINVRRPPGSEKGENVGRLVHELGHKVGNSGLYSQFIRYPGARRCGVTGYARRRSNEQFAEAFSAYVTYPDLLKDRCPASFNFFATIVFPHPKGKVALCSPNQLMASNSEIHSSESYKSESAEPIIYRSRNSVR